MQTFPFNVYTVNVSEYLYQEDRPVDIDLTKAEHALYLPNSAQIIASKKSNRLDMLNQFRFEELLENEIQGLLFDTIVAARRELRFSPDPPGSFTYMAVFGSQTDGWNIQYQCSIYRSAE